jgi:hypothetical protein
MTTENNITITMQDVDVVRQTNPQFNRELSIAAIARTRAELTKSVTDKALQKQDIDKESKHAKR